MVGSWHTLKLLYTHLEEPTKYEHMEGKDLTDI